MYFFLISALSVVMSPPLVHSMICLWRGNNDTSTWFFHIKMSFPLNTSKVFGWYARWFIYMLGGIEYVYVNVNTIMYIHNCCHYIKACCKHFQWIVERCDAIIREECDQNATEQQRTRFKRQQREIFYNQLDFAVSFHVKITE